MPTNVPANMPTNVPTNAPNRVLTKDRGDCKYIFLRSDSPNPS